jgi:hypothetical protein
MAYVIYEKNPHSLITLPVVNKNGDVIKFKSKRIANEERIFLQPSYDNLLIIKKEV